MTSVWFKTVAGYSCRINNEKVWKYF